MLRRFHAFSWLFFFLERMKGGILGSLAGFPLAEFSFDTVISV
jgi:hypothetical protein